MEYNAPCIISNAIIDNNSKSKHNFKEIFSQLIDLGCRDLQLRFYDKATLSEIEKLLILTEHSYIKSVEFTLPFNKEFTTPVIKKMIQDHVRIKNFIFHTSPKDKLLFSANGSGMGAVFYTKQEIKDCSSCGNISKDFFT